MYRGGESEREKKKKPLPQNSLTNCVVATETGLLAAFVPSLLLSQSVSDFLSVWRRVVFQGGAVFLPAGDRGVVRAVFTEVPGKRPPGAGAGS